MDGMKRFVETIRGIGWGLSRDENIAKARKIVSELNRFLYVPVKWLFDRVCFFQGTNSFG